jgi:hypothetical protein
VPAPACRQRQNTVRQRIARSDLASSYPHRNDIGERVIIWRLQCWWERIDVPGVGHLHLPRRFSKIRTDVGDS